MRTVQNHIDNLFLEGKCGEAIATQYFIGKQNGWLHALLESAQVFTGCIYSGEVLSMGIIPICTMNTVKS